MGNCFTADDTSPRSTADIAPNSPDPPLVSLLSFFGQLHGRKRELFGAVVPLHRDEILEACKKIGKAEEKIGRLGFQLVLKRSNSDGAAEAVARARGADVSADDIKLERFKVRTFDAGDKPPPAGGGGK